jgi:signal transduction histidine kinase
MPAPAEPHLGVLPLSILMVEDNPADAELAQVLLASVAAGLVTVHWESSLEGGLGCLKTTPFDGVLLDLSLPGTSGIRTLEEVLSCAPDSAVVVLTGLDDEGIGTEAVRAGAQDYLVKGRLNGPVLWQTLRYAMERHRLYSLVTRQNLEVEEKNRQLDEFAQLLSHDLKAPLRAIYSHSSWLEDEAARISPQETLLLLARLKENARIANELVDSMLADTARDARPDRETIGVQDLAVEAIAMLEAPTSFRVEAQCGATATVGNRVQLRRVFQNLVGNAVRHHDRPAGTVLVRAHPTETGCEITVEDDGPGIPVDLMPRLFGKSATGDPLGGGTGLGLYAVRQIVHAHGGTVTVERAAPRGTRFHIVLPAPR